MTQEISYASISGIDFGAKGRVLVRGPRSALIWFPGGPYYANMMEGTKYGSSSLQIVRNSMAACDNYTSLHHGGRLSAKLIESKTAEIDKEFGEGTAKKIDIKGTVALVEKPWFKLVPQDQLDWANAQRAVRKAEKEKRRTRRLARIEIPTRKEFTEAEIRLIHERFLMANDPAGIEIARKANVMLEHFAIDRIGRE